MTNSGGDGYRQPVGWYVIQNKKRAKAPAGW